MIRILHFADLHLGMENYGRNDPQTGLSSRIMDFLGRLDDVVEHARSNRADLVVFAGDAFKNRQPNPTLQREFAWRIRDLAEICPVVMVVGNHDLPASAQRASSLDIYNTLAVPNVLVGHDYELYTVQTVGGPVLVGTAPYPMRTQLYENGQIHHNKTIAEVDAELEAALQRELTTLAEKSLASEPADAPRILVGHFSVAGAMFSSERGVMIGRDTVVLLSELDSPAWDYVALGHIHKHQNLTQNRKGAPPVVYSGSLERIDFGEESDPKGFCWIEAERKATRYSFVPVRCRPFITVRIDVRGDADPMNRILSAIDSSSLQEAVVRVIIQADTENENQLRDPEIHAHLRKAGVNVIAAVKKEVERPSRARLGANAEELSELQLLERYFVAKNLSQERVDVLLQHAKNLLGDVDHRA